jgi:hypothetical protein
MPIGKEITMDELLAQFHPSVHDAIRRAAQLPGTTHLVMFENQLFDSSRFGERSVLAIGPGRSTKTLEEAYAGRLGQMASDMQIPVAHVTLQRS